MKIRLPVIEITKETLDEQSQLTLRALGKAPDFREDESSVVIETNHVSSWFAEGNSTIVLMSNGVEHKIEIDEASFSLMWPELTYEAIKSISYRPRIQEEDDEEDGNI